MWIYIYWNLSQWQKGTETASNNPTTTLKFPVSFSSMCYIVNANISYQGDASYHGISIKSIAKNQVVLNSGTYGSNPVWIHAIGK